MSHVLSYDCDVKYGSSMWQCHKWQPRIDATRVSVAMPKKSNEGLFICACINPSTLKSINNLKFITGTKPRTVTRPVDRSISSDRCPIHGKERWINRQMAKTACNVAMMGHAFGRWHHIDCNIYQTLDNCMYALDSFLTVWFARWHRWKSLNNFFS